MTITELAYFDVTGFFYDVQQPLAGGTTAAPQFSVMSGLVTFTPRLPTTIYVDDLDIGGDVGQDTALAVTPIVGQITNGQLCSINIPGTPGVELLANTAPIAAALAEAGITDLVYDVTFTRIVYAHQDTNQLANFAFIAPTDTTGVSITDAELTRYAWAIPGSVTPPLATAPWGGAYVKPSGGIPLSDLSSALQADITTPSAVYDVQTYGAIGNGTTDDTTAIQAAINAAATAGGGTVYFAAGIYKISAALVLADHVSLLGAGAPFAGTGGSRIRQVTAGQHGLYMATTSAAVGALEIRNLVIESTAVTGTAHGIYLHNNASGSTHFPFVSMAFRDLFIQGFTGYGFNAESLITSVLDRVTSQTNGGGFFLNGDAYSTGFSSVNTSVAFTSCYANGNTGIGYYLLRSTYLSLHGCACDSNGNQYVVDHCNSVVLAACGAEYAQTATATTGNGFTVQGGSTGITLVSCTTLYNQHYSIYITGTSYAVTVIGFLDNDQGSHAVHGLKIDAGSKITQIGCIFTSADAPSGAVTVLDDGAGNLAVQGTAYFGSTLYVESDLTLDSGNIHLTAYNALYAGANRTWEIGTFGSANHLGVESSDTGDAPDIYAAGTDTNIDISFTPKGTGKVKVGNNPVAVTASPTFTGHVTVPTPTSTGDAATKAYADTKQRAFLFNVKDYGAVGNGSTDDTSAIQAAISAATTNGGGTVFLPAATYLVSSLTLASRVTLRGDATNATTLTTTAGTGDVLAYSGSAGLVNVTVEDLLLSGPGTGTGNGVNVQNVGGAGNPNAYLTFNRVRAAGFGGSAFQVACAIVSTFDTCVAQSCGVGFYLLAGGTSMSLISCYANQCTTYGYHIFDISYSAGHALAADSCGTAYLIDSCNNVALTACGCEWADPDSASPGDGFKITGSTGITLTSPYTYQNLHYSYWITGSSRVVLINLMENSPVSATNCLKTDAGSQTTVIGISYTTANATAGTMVWLNDGAGEIVIPGTAFLAGVQASGAATIGGAATVNGMLNSAAGMTRAVQVASGALSPMTTAHNTFVFTGSSIATWTLPAVSGNAGFEITIKNRGSATLTVQRGGTDGIYTTSAISSTTVTAGSVLRLVNDAAYWCAV